MVTQVEWVYDECMCSRKVEKSVWRQKIEYERKYGIEMCEIWQTG